MNSPRRQPAEDSSKVLLVSMVLLAAIFAVYWPVTSSSFVQYDDGFMVCENPAVAPGLTLRGILWALTTSYYEYWHPVTWWSHMLDCELFGLRAGLHHLTSLVIHAVNSLLVFLVLRRMTGTLWRSAMVGALFALHPLHVESVAWIAERKDLLSCLFWLLSIWMYADYVKEPATSGGRKKKLFMLALVFFGLALMSKPMAVTLPFVLLLLDYWPLNRLRLQPDQSKKTGSQMQPAEISWRKVCAQLVREKVPFFVLAIASSVITYSGVKSAGNIIAGDVLSPSLRMANAPISYARYLWKTFWPTDLIVLYPMPAHWELWAVGGSILLLIVVSWFVWARSRSSPHLVFGWFSFLGTLVPTIGVVTVGFQSIADRYMYIPSIGLFAALVWGCAELYSIGRARNVVLGGVAALALIGCAWLARLQVAYWRNGISVWEHCLKVTPDNVLAHFNIGVAFMAVSRMEEARDEFRETVRLKPEHLDANLNLGVTLAITGHVEEATNYYGAALRIKPGYTKAHVNMGLAFVELGNPDEAIRHCAEALRGDPNDFAAYTCKGRALSAQGKAEEAIQSFAAALQLNGGYPDAYFYIGLELFKRGEKGKGLEGVSTALRLNPMRTEYRTQYAAMLANDGSYHQAINQYWQVLALKPGYPEVLNNLAWILATAPEQEVRNGSEAVRLAAQACEKTANRVTICVGTLAAAYAEAGQFEKAVETAQKACDLATARGELELVKRNQELLELFRKRQPYREAK